MRNTMKKTMFTSAIVMAMGMSATAMAADDIMLVVKKAPAATAQNVGAKSVTAKFESITVSRKGQSAEDVIAAMRNSGEYASVELDVAISTPNPSASPYPASYGVSGQTTSAAPNDAKFVHQAMTFGVNTGDNSGANILSAWGLLGDDLDNEVNIVVLDSGFYSARDVVYASGANFESAREDASNYAPPEDAEYCSAHGLGVASVIGATVNNENEIAGVAPNVKIHAGRVMDCGLGRLSDTARAINAYVNAEMPEGAPAYDGTPGVINMSLGGKVDYCPTFMQEAITNAVSKGWKVVVAAGNESIDVNGWAPANCENVITVGATDATGHQADFSNFGANVDVSAQGVDVVGLCSQPNEACWWEGTSFSAPIVAGAIALADKASSLSTPMIKSVFDGSAFSMQDRCPAGECGAGMIDVLALVEVAQANARGELNSITHALADKSECDQQWYVDNFGDTAPLCEMFKVQFMGGYSGDSTSYQLYRTASGNTDTSEYELVGEFDGASALMQDLSAEYDYKFKVCEEGTCGSDWFDMNTDDMATPSVCP
jgi:serine protease